MPEARVYVAGGPAPFPDVAALTGADGRFTLSLPARGTYELECAAEGFEPARAAVEASAGEAQVELRLGSSG